MTGHVHAHSHRMLKPCPYALTLQDAFAIWYQTGSDEALRSIPEGRAFLLECTKERRKEPLEWRRMSKLMGQAAAETRDRIRLADIERLRGILDARDELKAARNLKCECSGFALQVEGCGCHKGFAVSDALRKLWLRIEEAYIQGEQR